MLGSLVRFSTVTESCWFDANPFKMAFESTVACSEAENDCLFRTSQFVEDILVWIVSSSFSVKGCVLVILDEGSGFFVGEVRVWLCFFAALLCQLICFLISPDACVGRNPL